MMILRGFEDCGMVRARADDPYLLTSNDFSSTSLVVLELRKYLLKRAEKHEPVPLFDRLHH